MPQEKAKQLYQFLIYTTIFCLKKVPIVGAAVEFAADWQNNVKIQLNQQANLKVQERLAQIEQAMLCLPDEVRKMAQEMIAEQRRLGVAISPEQEEAVIDLASAMPAAIRERTQATLRQARQHGTALHTVIPVGEQVSTQERAEFYQSLLPARRSAFRENDWLPHRNPPWQLVQLLGAGGFGEVWEARHPQLNDRFAVKFCQDEASAKVLKQEATALFRLRKELPEHPNIVRLLDLQLDKEPYWLAFEYVPGGTLEALMRGASLTWQEVLAIFLPIVEGMSAVHKVGIVHRDLKPANILLTEVGVPKITDFGIGKVMEEQERTRLLLSRSLTMAGFGSAGYASPEQIRGLPAHPADDTYALGALLWQMVTHTLQPPQYVQRSLKGVQIPDVMKTLIIDCLENPRAERPQRAEDLLKVLQSVLFATHEKARRKAEEEAKQAQRTAEEEAKQARRKAEEETQARRKAENELARLKAAEEKKHTYKKVVSISAWRDNKQTRRQAEEAELARYYAEEEALRAQLQVTEELKLSPFNPLDWWRLLVWTLWYPQYLKLHREIFGQQQEEHVGRCLFSTLVYLPLLLPTLGLALGWLPHSPKAWNVETYWISVGAIGIDWLWLVFALPYTGYVVFYVCIFCAVGVAVGLTGSGLALAVAVGLTGSVISGMVSGMAESNGKTIDSSDSMLVALVAGVLFAGIMGGAAAEATEEGMLGYLVAKIGGFIVAGVATVGIGMAVVGRTVKNNLKTGEPSIIARIAFIILLLSNTFILFYSLLGGWRFFS